MEHEPDYQSCSLRDLLDIERRINREDYPERYARLCAEIETRRRQGDAGAAERMKPESGRVARLKVGATLRQTFVEVKQNWRPLTKALLAPAAAMSIVDFVDAEIGDEGLISGLLATLSGAIYVVYAVSCHRVILIGQGSLPNSWGIYFTRRELRFAGWSIAIIVLLIPLVMANGFVAVPMLLLLPDLPTETFVHAVWLLFLPMMYVASRLSLVLPATAVDKATSIAQAWHSSRGNGWPLTAALLVPSLLLSAIGWLWTHAVGPAEGAASTLLVSVWLCLLGAVEVAALSVAFRTLRSANANSVATLNGSTAIKPVAD